MSENQQFDPESVECATCGKVGYPNAQCSLCKGKAPIQSRAYTLSEVRSGRAPKDDRYGDKGEVGPKIISLPGSFDPRNPN